MPVSVLENRPKGGEGLRQKLYAAGYDLDRYQETRRAWLVREKVLTYLLDSVIVELRS